MVLDASEGIRVCFVDTDGHLETTIEELRSFEGPIRIDRVRSAQEAADLPDASALDCVVVRGAMEAETAEATNWIKSCERVRSAHPDVPVAVYSVNLDHTRLRDVFERGIDVVSDAPHSPELVYRQLLYAAGEEQHFQSAEELLESLFEYYPHHLFLKDEVGRFEAVSDATAAEYNLDPEVIVGLTDFDLLEYDTAVEAYREEQSLMARGERIVERIDHWVDEHGQDRWMSITKAPRYDDGGNAVGIVGSTREVTVEKRKEQMVRQLHTVSRDLVRAQSKADIGEAAMAITDDVPVFSTVQVVLERNGVDPIETGGRSLFDRYEQPFRTVVDTGEAQFVTGDGRTVDDPDEEAAVETVVVPLGGHGALGVAADAGSFTDFGVDLTKILAANLEAALDRADRERELERQNERLEEFASIVSHDLRNPLNVASAATELLAEETDSPRVERIQRALERMEQLIEALLTLARKGQVVGDTTLVRLESAVRTAWDVVDAPAATLTVDSSGVVIADRNRIVELFENLFRNAVEHGREDVTVTVGVRADNDGFYVADDGPGLGADASDQLFEMGYSSDPTGTGYGLYIVSTIADAHGWTINAGDCEGGGARFDVTGVAIDEPEFEARDQVS